MAKSKTDPKTKEISPGDLNTLMRKIPAVESVLLEIESEGFARGFAHEYLSHIAATTVRNIRESVRGGKAKHLTDRDEIMRCIVDNVRTSLERTEEGSLIPVINATGIILHTGLGRAPLSPTAAKRVKSVLADYSMLEIQRISGKRGRREDMLDHLLTWLSGAESATVVNNNAAAVMISLNALSKGREVIVSRGEQVEIGGSFRMPEIVEASGAIMKEIGTTNKTKVSDYEKAVTENTGAIFVAHTSNFRIMGFTESAPLPEVAKVARKHGIPLIYDLGGGVVYDLRDLGLPYEPMASEAIRHGADIVSFSGDKVLGGPQAGVIVGRKKYVDMIKSNPIARAVRCDKMALAALEGTLIDYTKGIAGFKKLPAMTAMATPVSSVRKKAEKLASLIDTKLKARVVDSASEAGSGALPLEKIPSAAVCIEKKKLSPERIAKNLRLYDPPVFGYINNDKVFLDLRTVFTKQIPTLAKAVNSLVKM